MQPRPENGNTLEPDAHADPTSTVGSQPWWRGVGYAAVPPNMLRESGSESPPLDLADGGEGSKGGQLQSENGINGAEDGSKGIQDMSKQTGSDGSYGQEHQNLQPVTSAMPPVIAEYLVPHTQLELGHSIACAPYSYSDTYYNALVTAYGTQALVHPQLLGMPHTRMPLPLEMAEEPVYVNAKQYHGILRRRQSRAKAELEKKLIKVRKPYLHESRHQHAMRRARGCGGRFLNTKKADGTAANPAAEKVGSSGEALQNCSGSQTPASVHPGNPRSGTATQVKGPTAHGMSEPHTYTNGNGGYQQRSGFQLSAFHSISGERGEEGDCSGQQRNGILVNRPQNRVVAIQ